MCVIPSRWFWDNDASPEMVFNKQEKQRKATEKILLHPLGNQVLEFANLVSRLEKEIRTLQIWEKAQEDAFDMDAYLAENRNRYLGVRPMSLLDWVFQNPPEKYKALVPIPKEPHELFHEMLMGLAPEGYGE
jgi:hypothetical protein